MVLSYNWLLAIKRYGTQPYHPLDPGLLLCQLWPSRTALILVDRHKAHAAYNVASPRGSDTVAAVRPALGERDLATWERAKAANAQGYETFDIFPGAMILSLQTRLSWRFMSTI